MRFLVTGLNHHTAPVEVREQVAISIEDLPAAVRALSEHAGVREAMIVSTCNRVELFAVYHDAPPDLTAFLAKRFPAFAAELPAHLYHHHDTEAVRHLFRVASSLDSMVVGEPQILGQVKEAFAVAREAGAAQGELDRLMQTTFAAAKRIRSETSIGSSSVSIASVAVDLALKIFGSLSGKKVLLVGAGKMGELAARHLLAQGAGSLTIANRTDERAQRLARTFGGQALPFAELREQAHRFDIVITSTGAQGFLFRRDDGQRFLSQRRGRPMFLIDIAVPRDVDPETNRVDGVFLYDIDDLQSVAAANLADRSREAAKAEALIEAEMERFSRKASMLDVVPALVALQGSVEAMRQAELRRAAARLAELTPAQRDAVETLTRGLANKFLHAPMQALRSAAAEGDQGRVQTLRDVFHLPEQARDEEPAKQPADEHIEVRHS